jgi:phosphotransferase system enzyme I (PtsI)
VADRPPISGERSHRGFAVSGGVAHARILVLGQTRRSVDHSPVDPEQVPAELDRLNQALVRTRRDITAVKEQVAAAMGAEEAGLFEAHLLVIEDSTLIDEVARKIRAERLPADTAFHVVSEKYVAALEAVDDAYLRERAADLRDVAGRVIDHLQGVGAPRDLRRLSEPCIIVAHDLAPSTAATLDREHVLGFATEAGGRTSHTAIMARKLGIPAIVGLGPLLEAVRDGEYALLDGHGGVLTVNPTDQTLFEYGQLKQRRAQFEEKLALLREQPAVTLDGHRVTLAANIDGPEDMAGVQSSGADGVGLFRTEFLFINRRTPPTEEEQYQAYRAVAERVGPGSDAVLRTLDLGGDKLPGALARTGEPNPFLGWRAIRISLGHPEDFRLQLRAMLRASAHGKVRLLYPMISSVEELRAANALLAECRGELRREGLPFDEAMPVGTMIEIPAAALIADTLARETDFFSIGTNDLTGYTLAVDRMNERVAHLYQPTHPAVIRLIRMTVEAGRRHGRRTTVCGEMAGEPALVPLLVGLGIDELSATPALVPQVKFLLRRLKLPEAKALAEFALGCDSAAEIHGRSAALAREIAPNLFGGG